MQRFSREPAVYHLDVKGQSELPVVGFLCEQAHRLFIKVWKFFRWEAALPGIAAQ